MWGHALEVRKPVSHLLESYFGCIVLLVHNHSNSSFVRGKYDYVLIVC